MAVTQFKDGGHTIQRWRSRNSKMAVTQFKDGGHTIQSAVVENRMLHANLMALSVIEPELR